MSSLSMQEPLDVSSTPPAAWTQARHARAPLDLAITERFAAMAREHASRPALSHLGETLSYAELDALSDRLAAQLISRGVPAGARLAVLMERGIDMIIAVLAALKAGCAYVPVDADAPPERLAHILADCAPAALLTEPRHATRAGDSPALRVDARRSEIDPAPELGVLAGRRARADDPAYLIYTSGSTGRPKGVVVAQRSVVDLVVDVDYITIRPEDCVAQVLRFGFDAATFDIWGALLNGACLSVFPELAQLPLQRFTALLAQERVTVLSITSSLLHTLILEAPESLSTVATLIFGSESANAAIIQRVWSSCTRPPRLVYTYGPTESTTFSTWIELSAGDLDPELPIGRPITGRTLLVLDPAGQPVPVGTPGELYVGGAGVALGYHGQPQLTQEKFLPLPGLADADARFYRTGDVVRWRADGLLQFIGREDHQVKINGNRIELGEIEHALCAHADVAQAVVVAVKADNEDGPLSLRACLVAAQGRTLDVPALRAFAARRLSPHFMPAEFLVLPTLPLTHNGKVDRQALAQSPAATWPPRDAAATPRDTLEERLFALVQDVLGFACPRDANLFSLGANSLQVMRALHRIAREFGLELSLADVYATPTLDGIAQLVRTGTPQRGEALALVRLPRGQALPLSLHQERLFFLDQAVGGSPFYNVAQAFLIEGSFDAAVLQQALTLVAARHEAFRTRFALDEGGAVQRIDAEVTLAWTDRPVAPEALDEAVQGLAFAPFELCGAPAWRAGLLRLAPERQVFVLCMHHILTDGLSVGVIMRELSQACGQLRAGQAPSFEPLALDYADYAAAQAASVDSPSFEGRHRELIAALGQDLPTLDLPYSRHVEGRRTYAGRTLRDRLDAGLTRALRSRCQDLGCSLYALLFSAVGVVLARFSGQEELLIGTVVANRDAPALANMVGFFVNTLALRIQVPADESATALIRRNHTQLAEAFRHQDLPFGRLVQALRPDRDLNANPLFQVAFGMQTGLGGSLELPGVRTSQLDIESPHALFDLNFIVVEDPDGCRLLTEFSTERFEEGVVRSLVDTLLLVLEQLAADPERRVADLDLLTPATAAELVRQGSLAATPAPLPASIASAFAEQLGRHADRTALDGLGHRVSYRELDAWTDELAADLQDRGVAPRSIVGVLLDRSYELVATLLAIAKCGATYLPIDPGDAPERIAHMLAEAQVALVVAESALRPRLPADVPVRPLERGALASPASGRRPRAAQARATDLAYVTYTSGSTGRPKGVCIPHQGVLRLVKRAGFLDFKPDHVFLHHSSAAFDASTLEIWGALLNGARLAVLPPGLTALEQLADFIRRHEVDVVWLTAGLFHLIVDEWPALLGLPRHVLAGGDVLSVGHVRRALTLMAPGARLIAGYGPTENTTFTSTCDITPALAAETSIPIGRAIADTSVYLLDERLRPVPMGAVGELYTGGLGLATGYLARPDLSAERFVASPFEGAGSPQLYRSSDLCRLMPDGQLRFIGRADGQVKVRGFRVELSEVEAALRRHADVASATVMAHQEAGQPKALLAFVVPRDGSAPEAKALRAHVAALLPDYMVPQTVTLLTELPLNRNGKVDRGALLALQRSAQTQGAASPVEARPSAQAVIVDEAVLAQLREIWAASLGLAPASIQAHDDFFELGGHSLQVLKILSQLKKRFAVDVSLHEFFERPTLAALGESITTLQWVADGHKAGSGIEVTEL